MAEGWARGIRPEDFLALTHTDTAGQALRAARGGLFGEASVMVCHRVDAAHLGGAEGLVHGDEGEER